MRTNCVKLDSLGPSFELIARCQIAASSAAPAGLSRLVFTPTVKTVGYSLSSRWDLIYAAANLAPDLRAPAAVTISSRILAFLNLLICRTCADRRSHIRF